MLAYHFLPSRTSGGRYHSVTTSLEYVFVGNDFALANPKSANFNSPFELINRFWGCYSFKQNNILFSLESINITGDIFVERISWDKSHDGKCISKSVTRDSRSNCVYELPKVDFGLFSDFRNGDTVLEPDSLRSTMFCQLRPWASKGNGQSGP